MCAHGACGAMAPRTAMISYTAHCTTQKTAEREMCMGKCRKLMHIRLTLALLLVPCELLNNEVTEWLQPWWTDCFGLNTIRSMQKGFPLELLYNEETFNSLMD